jgi:hypothetical protein
MSWRKSFVALKLLEANTVEMDLRDTESGAIQTVVFQLEGDNSKETITSFKALSLYPLTFQFEEARLTRASFDHGLSEQELDYFEKAVNTEIIVTGLVEVTAEKIMAGNVYKLSQARRAISGKRWHMPPVELVTVKTQS